jgi:Ni/Fe-hydrogenase 1 B-type cytochrome subunit
VWQWPVRAFHWINAICITVLCVTGYLMGNPIAIQSGAEAWNQYWFGTVRFIHFLTAYVWVAVAVLRVYWGFVGNDYVRFRHFLPLNKNQWRNIVDVFKMDVFQVRKEASFEVGHNALAGFTYAVMFVFFLFQILTGFGLYSAMSASWFVDLFAWVVPFMGGDHIVRILHHAMLWVFVVFFMVHVYLSFYHDYVEATGTVSSMIGGWKFIRLDQVERVKAEKVARGDTAAAGPAADQPETGEEAD